MELTYDLGTRKLQKVGNSIMLPIPVTWIRNIKASKGDVLRIEMLPDHSLRIMQN